MLDDVLMGQYLYMYEDIPDWYRDNEYIRDRYRGWNRPYSYYIKSIFKLHNETINIWTHLVGAIIFICSLIVYNTVRFETLEPVYNTKNTIVTNIYMTTATLCFTLSTVMHTIYPKSKRVCCNSCTLDYIGITLLISGSYSPFAYYLFYCDHDLERLYIILINTIALINIAISFLSFMYKSKYFRFKALVYIVYVAFIGVPILNKFIRDDYVFHREIIYDIKYYFISLISYVVAIIFYLTRFPESIFNMRYIFSHGIFHIWVVIGAVCILFSIFEIQFLYLDIDCFNETIVANY